MVLLLSRQGLVLAREAEPGELLGLLQLRSALVTALELVPQGLVHSRSPHAFRKIEGFSASQARTFWILAVSSCGRSVLWTIEFVGPVAVGARVVVFETGRVFGGDAQYYYLGHCEVRDGTLHAEIEITHHAGQPSTVFGPAKKARLILSGKVQEPVMDLRGHLAGNPTQIIHVRCTKREEVP